MLRTVPGCLAASQRRPQAMVQLSVPMSTMPMTEFHAPGESSSVRAMKFPAALLTRMSSGASLQMEVDHGFDGVEAADVAGEGVDCSLGGEFGGGLFENFFAAAADVDGGAEFEEALRPCLCRGRCRRR